MRISISWVLAHLVLAVQITATIDWMFVAFLSTGIHFFDVAERVTLIRWTLMMIGLVCGIIPLYWLPNFSRVIAFVFFAALAIFVPEEVRIQQNLAGASAAQRENYWLEGLAEHTEENGDLANAERAFRNILEKEKSGYFNSDIWGTTSSLIRVLERQGKLRETEQVYLSFLREAGNKDHDSSEFSSYRRSICEKALGDLYLNQGRYAEAENAFRQAIEFYGDCPGEEALECHVKRARALRAIGNLKQAELEESEAKALRIAIDEYRRQSTAQRDH